MRYGRMPTTMLVFIGLALCAAWPVPASSSSSNAGAAKRETWGMALILAGRLPPQVGTQGYCPPRSKSGAARLVYC